MTRREACRWLGGGMVALGRARFASGTPEPQSPQAFGLRHMVASCLYGNLPLATVVGEIHRAGSDCLDLWPRPHGTQREEVETMGRESFAALLQTHRVQLGAITRYDLGPFRLQPEMHFAQGFGARLIITGSGGPAGLQGQELKAAVGKFVENMKPHLEAAARASIIIGIENHGRALIQSPDSMRYLAELDRSGQMGIALAPYHLPQDASLMAGLIRDLGDKLVHFYAWQHGNGAMQKLPKQEELLQLPGRGPLSFGPLLEALKKMNYRGRTSIFMHPFPRGIPILPEAGQVTDILLQARDYLERTLAELS